jgi:putative flippase GtrA
MPWENKELGRYILNLIFNYIYTTAILVLFVDILNLDEIIAKIAQIIAVALINFFILKKFVFIT